MRKLDGSLWRHCSSKLRAWVLLHASSNNNDRYSLMQQQRLVFILMPGALQEVDLDWSGLLVGFLVCVDHTHHSGAQVF